MALNTIATSIKGGKSDKDRLAQGEAMLADRVMGMRPSAMMEKYQVSQATLYRRLDLAIAARIAPTVDKYRETQNALLDDQMAKWGQQEKAAESLIQQGIETSDLQMLERGLRIRGAALDGILRTAERRAKLNGLDAPVKVEATVVQVEQKDTEMEELVRRAKEEQDARSVA